MGYRVDYSSVKKVRGMERNVASLPAIIGIGAICLGICVKMLFPEKMITLSRALLPGDPAVTAAAFEQMYVDLSCGADVEDTLREFCIQIIEGAELALD